MKSVALIVMDLRNRRIDRNLVKVGPAESSQLRVVVRKISTLQQGIVAEVNAGDDVLRAESDLLGFGKEVVRISIQHHSADRVAAAPVLRE